MQMHYGREEGMKVGERHFGQMNLSFSGWTFSERARHQDLKGLVVPLMEKVLGE